ncbi:MAG TPA: helix-turn-helix domain-containing protein [Acidimicrobiales bacterium]|nr:helix-turn-helix domain-containing protein [Acidimicrobiales bacterium]
MHPSPWLGTKEAAERLGVTLRTLYRFIDEGSLSAYRFGRVIRVRESDLDEFIERSKIVPGSLEHLYPEMKSTSSTASRGR